MLCDNLAMRWCDACRLPVSKICRLMDEDKFTWEYAFDGTDCEYIAVFAGKTFRLNCDPRNPYFVVEGKRIAVSPNAITALCQAIARQQTRLRLKKDIEDFEELNRILDTPVNASNS